MISSLKDPVRKLSCFFRSPADSQLSPSNDANATPLLLVDLPVRGESYCVLGTSCETGQLIVQSPNEGRGRAGPGRNGEGVRRRASQRPNAMRMQVFQRERAPRCEVRK